MKQALMRNRSSYPRCLEDHPPLKIGDHTIYGGSCSNPLVINADVYVGFDHSMNYGGMQYPWSDGVSFQYLIQDMHAPSDPTSFKKLIEWLSVQLIAQKLIHLGCIGGHGRTGLVLSALVKHMTGNADATEYVRKNYCEKAVESMAQIQFLKEHFGINPVAPAKGHAPAAKGQQALSWREPTVTPATRKEALKKPPVDSPRGVMVAYPTANSPMNIWSLFDNAVKSDKIKSAV